MKACVLYGPKDLRIEERPVSEPQPGFVRLRMGGVGICGSDLFEICVRIDGYTG